MDHLKLLALLVVPFLSVSVMAEQRELPRHALIEVVAMIALGAALIRGGPLPTRMLWTGAAPFVASLFLSSMTSDSPGRSL